MRSRSSLLLPALAAGAALVPATITRPLGAQGPTRAAAATPGAGVADTTLVSHLAWRFIGPARGGRVTTVTGVPQEPFTFYLGSTGGGVWKTTDAGVSWASVSDGQIREGSIGAVAVAPSDPNVVYVGTGSDGLRSNVSTGRGIYRSADAGKTWTHVGLPLAGHVGAIRVHPTDPNTAWAAAIGNAFGRNPERGVFKTTDGGRTWQRVLFVSDSTGAVDLELAPDDPNTLYASMWRGERKPWTIISGAREGGIYRSRDGGATWTKLGGGLPTGLFGKSNVAVSAADPKRVYALIEAKPGAGLYRSDDRGETWRLVNTQATLVTRPFYYTTLGADPTNADVVYAGAEGFFRSVDGGATFRPMDTPHGDNHDIWINPRDGKLMIQANDGGANVSLNGGRTWSTQYNQPTAEIYQVTTDEQVPYNVYGAQQDQGGTLIVPSLPATASSLDDPIQGWRKGPGCETGPVMPHPTSPDTVYGACKGQFMRMSMRTGQERQYWIGAQSLYGQPNSALTYRFQRVAPMATSPHDPSVVYYGSQHVHRSRDGGITWEAISPDLTANDPKYRETISGAPITIDVTGEEMYATLYEIAESPVQAGVIWTGANDGPIQVTRDGGTTWTNVTPRGLPPGGRVQTVEPSPHAAGRAYAAVLRYQLGDFQPYLYRTDDFGRTWTRLTDGKNGIPLDHPVRVVREDPVRPGLLYAGTEFGIFFSTDDGRRWQPLQRNLPATPITDLQVRKDGDLVISTQGRGFWILDDVGALRQAATPAAETRRALAAAPAQLFAPRPAMRMRYRAAFGGEESSRGGGVDPTYPAAGAAVDYWVAPGTTGTLALEVLDSTGTVIRRITSEGPGERSQRVELNMRRPEMERLGTPRLDAAAGMHRFTWDLALAGPLDPTSARSGRNGPLVPPGRYTMRLSLTPQGASAPTWTQAQPLTLRPDPRAVADGMTPTLYAAQLAHALAARDLVTEVNGLAARVRAARTALVADSTAGKPVDAARLTAVRAMERALSGETVRYGRPGLVQQVSYLYGLTNQADQPVGKDAVERLAALRQEVAARAREVEGMVAAR